MISIEDKIAIQELVARFAHCSDYCDWEALGALYTPDVVTELEGLGVSYAGIPAQLAHAQESARQTEGKNRHYFLNVYVTEEGGQVFANYMIMNVNAGKVPMAATIVVTGRQRDTVIKTEAGWKISRRSVWFDQDVTLDF